MFTTDKIAQVSVINDLATDSRVLKTCHTLIDCGYSVVLTGRRLPNSLPLPLWPFTAHRMHLLFRKGPLFYAFFNFRLFFKLLFSKADLLYANDLDTLLPNYLVSKIRSLPLIYDSHELFCEVPELLQTPLKRKIWLKLEAWILPKLQHCITVNESIAGIFQKQYGTTFTAVRNIPEPLALGTPKTRQELGLPLHKKIILLQGAGINIDRGAEELVEAVKLLDDVVLLIIGSGDVWPLLTQRVSQEKLENKVKLISRLPKNALLHYTANADLGISIDKNTNLNYYYSLPNKIFDYIHAGLPILTSRLPEIENIVNRYQIGDFISDHQPANIAAKIKELLSSGILATYKQNTQKAAQDLNWQAEQDKLKAVIRSASTQRLDGKNS